jgi:adenylate cyclase
VSELFVVNGICGGTVFFLPDVPTVLGRSAECQVQIADPWISSMHAMFEKRGKDLWLVDLESRNGTWVNDQKVREAPVAPGYRLRFGKTEVELREGMTPRPLVPLLSQSGTVVRYLSDLQAEARAEAAEPSPRRDTDPASRKITSRGPGSRRQIAVLNDIGRALVDAPDLDAALARILHVLATAVRAERSTVLLTDETGRMTPRATEPAGSPPRVSETVVAAAAKGRAGLLTLDAQQDLRFTASQSVVAEGIRSCLCVPVWADNRILGMLVLDRGHVDPFTADDLELTTLVGYQAALVIERERFLARAGALEQRSRELLRHFPVDVATTVLAQAQSGTDPLDPQAREDVTVLVAGFPGLSSLSGRLPADDTARRLSELLATVAGAVFEEHGVLDRIGAGGVTAVFGAPLPVADAATRALRAAWRALELLEAANRDLPPDLRVAFRAGIATGTVVAGVLGAPGRTGFSVVGDPVVAAARLESMAPPGTVYAARETGLEASDAFSFQELGRRVLSEEGAAVDVLQVIGPTAAA